MSGQHTPGPWTIEKVESSDNDTFVYARIGPAGRGSIAYSGVYGHKKGNAKLSESEAMANATLIAKAPEQQARIESLEAENKKLKAEIRDALDLQRFSPEEGNDVTER